MIFTKHMIKGELKETLDYADDSNWIDIQKNGTKDVDVFFLCPTAAVLAEGECATIDEMKELAPSVRASMASAYETCANVYMPYYRQIPFCRVPPFNRDGIKYRKALQDNIPYDDVQAALDYYFENYNNGKPFILAGHSQGSCMSLVVLENYMKEHPEYYKRMIAAYVLGWAPSREYLASNPHLKFAEGETDTGVIVSWNIIGPGAVERTIVVPENAVVINPINWKLDDTYAGPEENRGSFIDGKNLMNYADAKINLEKGYVESNTELEYLVSPIPNILGDKSLHNGDYALFYNNIRENAIARVNAYMNK